MTSMQLMAESDLDSAHTGQLHVLDLPHPSAKPSAEALLSALDLLVIGPPSFEAASVRPLQVHPEGVPHYLTRIIASPLEWISDESTREQIWDRASRRLAGKRTDPNI